MTETTRIGFVGVGRIGGVMADRLLEAGYPMTVCDTDPALQDRFRAKGARIALSPAALAEEAEIVFLSLPSPAALRAVSLGPDGLVSGRAARIVVDLSTSGPQVIKEIAPLLADSGKILVDAPVSGGITGAAAGALTIMTSGSDAALDEVMPMLRVLGRQIFVMGSEPGLGQTMKLVNNMVAACCAVASFEAAVFGAKGGLSAERMLDVLNVSSGRNFATLEKMPKSVLPGTFPPGFATELMLKDVRLAVEEAEALGASPHMGLAARAFFERAVAAGFTSQDYAETIKLFEAAAGAQVRAAPAVAG